MRRLAFLLISLNTFAGASEKHLFVLSGQSNMREPLIASFKKCVEEAFGKDKVIVASVARPSRPIKMWYRQWQPPTGIKDKKPSENGSLYDELILKVKKSIKGQSLASVSYIWMQGEADAKAGWGSVYEKSFLGVLDQLKTDLKVKEVNFVVGRINDFWLDPKEFPDGELVRKIQVQLGEGKPKGAWIDTDDLNRGVNPWGGYSPIDGHFPPPAYRVMGQRFAKAACKLIDSDVSLSAACFREVFFDTAEDVKSHAAVGKPVRSTIKELSDANPNLVSLTDGEFAAIGGENNQWFKIKPSEKAIELVLDLGKVQQVHAIGLHTLFSPAINAQFPDTVLFQHSKDGENFQASNSRYNKIQLTKSGRLHITKSRDFPQGLLVLTEQVAPRYTETGVQARYIKITIQTGKQWVLIDEIIVNPILNTDN